jgi:hypothetical protein
MSANVSKMSVHELMKTCEGYFLQPVSGGSETEADAGEARAVPHETFLQAKTRLAVAPSAEMIPWARALLSHADVVAWECGAEMLGALAEARLLLPEAALEIVAELDELVRRPKREDAKERRAKGAALLALGHLRAARSLVSLAQRRDIKADLADPLKEAFERYAGKKFTTLALALKFAKDHVTAETRARAEWTAAMDDREATDFVAYSASRRWGLSDLVDHPKFGRGVVTKVADTSRIQVLFEQGPRLLVQSAE